MLYMNVVSNRGKDSARSKPFLPALRAAIAVAARGSGTLRWEISWQKKTESKVYVASQDLKNLVRAPSGFDVAKSGKVTWPSSASDLFDNKEDDWKQDGAA